MRAVVLGNAGPQVGITNRVVRGSLWSLGGQGATLIASLAATPLVIRLLGAEAYGLYALVGVLIGYLGCADMGMSVASTRFASVEHAKGDENGEVAVVWTSLVLVSLATVLAASVVMWSAPIWVPRVVNLPEHLRKEAVSAFRLAALAFVARSIAGVLNTPQLVRLRLDIQTLINSGTQVGQILLVPVFLTLGGGVTSAVAVVLLASLISAVLNAVFSTRLLPALASPEFRAGLAASLLRFGTSMLVVFFAGALLFNLEKPLLAVLASLREVGYYAVAFSFARLLAVVPGALSQSLLPAFTRLQAEPDRAHLQVLYERVLRGLLLWSLPTISVLWVLAHPILQVWAGDDIAHQSLTPLRLLLIGTLFDGLSYVPRSVLEAVGKPQVVARCQLKELGPFLFLAYLLVGKYGAMGAAMAWSLRCVFESLWVFRQAHRTTQLTFLDMQTKPACFGALLVILSPVLAGALAKPSIGVLAILMASSLLLYAVISWTKVLTLEERAWMLDSVRGRRGASTLAG